MTILRPARPADLDAVARLWGESWLSTGLETEPGSVVGLRARVDVELAAGWDLWVTEEDGAVVAMLALRPDLAKLDQLFVAPGAQRRGVGVLLLRHAQAIMPEGFTLWTYAANPARRFYDREGLTCLGERPHPHRGHLVADYAWRPDPT